MIDMILMLTGLMALGAILVGLVVFIFSNIDI
jgi:hypothetical protein